MNITDIHTHDASKWPGAIVSCTPGDYERLSGQYPHALFSVGIHPWDTDATTAEDLQMLDSIAGCPRVVAIGEAGLDLLRGASPDVQERIFAHHIELSERLGKPLIIHCVKGWDRLLALHNRYRPRQHWAIHGFRGKPQLARQLADRGIWLSLGTNYNPSALEAIPREQLLTESDEAKCTPVIPGFDATAAVSAFLNV